MSGWWFQIFFYFHPNLINIVQMGWNHQPDVLWFVSELFWCTSASRFQGFMLREYVFAVATALAKTYLFLLQLIMGSSSFPCRMQAGKVKVGIGWDPTLFTYDPGGDPARIGGGVSKLPNQTKTFCRT